MNKLNINTILKEIPSVNRLIEEINPKEYNLPYPIILRVVRKNISRMRKKILKGENFNIKEIKSSIINELKILKQPSLQKVINGTGIVLHTGLGRAPFSKQILENLFDKLSGYLNIELNLENGFRGERAKHLNLLFEGLTSSKDTVVVNNCASAVLLSLNTFGENKEVIVSRGEQVEIGGSFRIPDIITKAGCKLIEVGTTNRTHLKDYKNAINKNTGLILVAHTCNYIVSGFTKSVDTEVLIKLAKSKKIPIIIDLGSGALLNLKKLNLPAEPIVKHYVKVGFDAVTFSGDKLLGGPQSGIIVGKQRAIKKIRENPLYRALRCDKITYTLLEETLRTYYDTTTIKKENLTWNLFLRRLDYLENLGLEIINNIPKSIQTKSGIKLLKSKVEAGSGSLPVKSIESWCLIFNSNYLSAKKLHLKFLNNSPPILGFIHNKKFRIDLKAILVNDTENIRKAILDIYN